MTNRTDTFTTSQDPLLTPSDGLGNYTITGGTYTVSGGRCVMTPGGLSYATLEADVSAVEVYMDIPVAGADGAYGLVARYVDSSNFWRGYLNRSPDRLYLQSFVAGSQSFSAEYTHTAADGDYLLLVCKANDDIELWLNGTLRLSTNSATHASGTRAGMITYATTSQFDNLSITGLAGGGSSTIAADQGTFTHTGQTANLLFGRVLAADSGTFTNSGQDVTLTKTTAYSITADYGSFSLAGQDVAFQKTDAGSYVLTAEVGLFSLVGQGALASYSMNAEIGSFVIAGQEVAFSIGVPAAYSLTADAGSYSLTGQNARLDWSGAPIVPNRQAGIYMGMRIGL